MPLGLDRPLGPDRRALRDIEVAEAVELLGLTVITASLDRLTRAVAHLKELLMTTKDELQAQLTTLGGTLGSLKTDVDRIAADMQTALANNDLTSLGQSVDQLQQVAQGIDDAVNAADPAQPSA